MEQAPEKYAAEAQFAPKYQALTIDMLKQATPELLKLYEEQIAPAMGRTEAASRASSRAGDIADIAKLGPQARAAEDEHAARGGECAGMRRRHQ